MRRILIDYARQRKALKRGDGQRLMPLEDALAMSLELAPKA